MVDEALGGAGEVGRGDLLGPDRRVGADEAALVALDAVLGDPLRALDGDAALLQAGRGRRDGPVEGHLGDGQEVALEPGDRVDDLPGVGAGVVGDDLGDRGRLGDLRRDGDGLEARGGPVDGVPVHLDDLLALAAVGLLDGLLHQGDGLVLGQDAGELEEAGLHDRVDAQAQAELAGHLQGVDGVDLDLLVDDRPLHVLGQVLEDLGGLPVGVDEERPALADALEDVEPADVGGLVEGDEIDRVEEVLRLDRAACRSGGGRW